ncbi:encapsulin [Rhabdochromatium marinum]|uniref:encapsulin n=1 Tax=Rhabdochromatium marinum TaxID=48729 RepID=UPI0019074818|nr:family 1 encapsulin nanocompartment shell protein [Rhabdochromatium marinum]MBK1650564.1 hypothetical protein [Rhabdochromatium marinum]
MHPIGRHGFGGVPKPKITCFPTKLQVDHLRRLREAGLYKAPIEGAVLVDPRVGELKVGQDLRVGFAASDGIHLKLFISESLVFLLNEPQAICTLEDKG